MGTEKESETVTVSLSLTQTQYVNSFMRAGVRPLAPSHVGARDALSQFVYPTILGWWRVKYLVDQGSCSQVPDQPVWYSGSRPLGIT